MDELIWIVIGALINGVFLGVFMYIGMTKGSAKTVDIALDKIEKRGKKSPTAKRLMKLMEMADKLFGDKQAVEQITRFFREAADLVSSPEAKNFFKNAAEAMKQFGGDTEKKPLITIPEKPS